MPAHQTLQAHFSQAVEALRRSARAALDALGCTLARNRRGSCQRVLTNIADLLQALILPNCRHTQAVQQSPKLP